jgi:DNA-binding phage protein
MAFRAVKAQIQKEKAEQSSVELAAQAENVAIIQMREAAKRARESQPAGKGDILPDNILEKLLAGDITAVLDYIKERGNGLRLVKSRPSPTGKRMPIYDISGNRAQVRDSIAMGVFRNLAARLLDVEGLKVNVVFDENMIYDQIGRYDSKTNTMFVGPNGLDEATILHELLHAATVKIIHQFYTDASKLAPHARKAVEHLIRIAALAKARLGSNPKFAPAFENLYEFVAYSQTDMDFQVALSREQVTSAATVTARDEEQAKDVQLERELKGGASRYDGLSDTLWKAYTGTIAYLYKLFRPGEKQTKILTLVPTQSGEDIKNKVQNPGRGLTGKAREAAIVAFNKKLRAEKERNILRVGGEKKAFEAKVKKELEALDKEFGTDLTEAQKFDVAIERLNKKRELTANEKAAFDVESLFDKEEEYEANIPDIDTAEYVPYEQGITNLKREILREPGYKGNLLLEASEMVSMILEAPEGGIAQLAGKQGLGGSELYATTTEEGAEPTPRSGGINDPKNREFYERKGKEAITSKTRDVWKAISTAAGWRDIVRRFQDKSVESRSQHKKLDMAGLINRDVDGAFNNFDEQRDLASTQARNYLNTYLRIPMDNIKQAVSDYAKLTKKNLDDVLIDLHMFAEMFHEPERRHMKWLRSVPLSTTKNLNHNGKKISAAQRRIDILGDPRTGKPGLVDRVELTEAQQQQLRAELEYLAKNFADPLGDSPRIKNEKMRERLEARNKKAGTLGAMKIEEDSSAYNVLGINQAEVDLRKAEYDALSPEQRALLDKIFADAKVITQRTAELDKIGNYWSYPVSNLVGIYDYQHYMPFKGVSKQSVVDQYLAFDEKATGKDLQDIAHSADGRFSVSDNPFTQMLSDAYRSAGRAGRRDYMQSIKNAVKPNKYNPTGTGVIEGEVAKHIEFAERNVVDLSEFKGGNNIFVYNPDGSIDIVRIRDPKLLNALRYSFRDAAPMLDMANAVTGFFGAMHTRYNYNFAPLNFVRDALTNAWNIGASKLGPLKSAKYIQMMSAAIVKNGLGKAMEVAFLHEKGDPASQRILLNAAKSDPFVRDMLEYLQFGGKTTYMESFSLKSTLSDLSTRLGKRRIMDTVESFNEFIDVWNNMFEFTSRTAAYSLYKQEALKRNLEKGMSNVKGDRGMSPAEIAAAQEAAAWVKNLANFEKAGEYAREMGAFYMFIRPSATGAVRAAEAALPAFRSMESAVNDLPAQVRNDPAALENFKKEYALEKRNARIMIGTLLGMGYVAYWMSSLMSPDDEWKRNNVKHDNMQQWTRFARFHIPDSVSERLGLGRDVVFQLPWGFGLGAFAATGAQFAGMTVGNSSMKDFLVNSFLSMMDSFLPIPVSRMSPIETAESPAKWVIDSVAPTAVRPLVEFVMNTNGIGQAINSAATRRMGDAYTGGDRIPEAYIDAADWLYLKTKGYLDWSPNTMYFFTNSYLDGLARVGELFYSWSNIEAGEKEFNAKTDAALFGSFFGAKTNVDSREYGEIEKRIKDLDKRLYTLDERAPDKAAEFDVENPLARGLVDAYKERQGELSKLRAEANEIRRDRNLSEKDRRALVRISIMEQNLLKHEMVQDFKAYGEKP